ncbi:MAG TPA: hypothetical protein VFB02_06375 [Bradyrhizobium sp.]|nr:hypothetical protein [Bradyrhizobium sp.]
MPFSQQGRGGAIFICARQFPNVIFVTFGLPYKPVFLARELGVLGKILFVAVSNGTP